MSAPSNDTRGFVHKRIGGALGGFITGGGISGAISGFIGGGSRGRGASSGCPGGFQMIGGQCLPSVSPSTPIPTTTGCPPGLVWDPAFGACVSPKSPVGSKALADQFGEAVMGQYGAGLVPGNRMTDVAVCPRGTVLGKDGICYNKRDLRNSERMWPRGRRPLLTGGDMRAIATAAAAARKLQAKTKQLQGLGMLKKPAPRRRQLAAGHHAHVAHD